MKRFISALLIVYCLCFCIGCNTTEGKESYVTWENSYEPSLPYHEWEVSIRYSLHYWGPDINVWEIAQVNGLWQSSVSGSDFSIEITDYAHKAGDASVTPPLQGVDVHNPTLRGKEIGFSIDFYEQESAHIIIKFKDGTVLFEGRVYRDEEKHKEYWGY